MHSSPFCEEWCLLLHAIKENFLWPQDQYLWASSMLNRDSEIPWPHICGPPLIGFLLFPKLAGVQFSWINNFYDLVYNFLAWIFHPHLSVLPQLNGMVFWVLLVAVSRVLLLPASSVYAYSSLSLIASAINMCSFLFSFYASTNVSRSYSVKSFSTSDAPQVVLIIIRPRSGTTCNNFLLSMVWSFCDCLPPINQVLHPPRDSHTTIYTAKLLDVLFIYCSWLYDSWTTLQIFKNDYKVVVLYLNMFTYISEFK